ncbi:hypothetical protein AMTR_s00070p00146630 [Amborella trichopoda]|uniref:Uncharacterized protein n=1 Tax=Amborella trichopoda TaxID=13333 RepID=U5DEK4_AMBTC|nr:hypothetical protein AMTR_s00070p00146630 [Amborella trichopoda]
MVEVLGTRGVDIVRTFNSWGVSEMTRANEVSITRKTNCRLRVEVLGTRGVDVTRTYNSRDVSEMA